MATPKRRGCWNGPCDDSVANGGPGCHLCDVIAKLPQPASRFDGLTPEPRHELELAPTEPEDRPATTRRRKDGRGSLLADEGEGPGDPRPTE
jgi:hypothetical protein